LNPPPIVCAATKEYREDMDIIGRWIEERCDRDDGSRVPTSSLYEDFKRWAEAEAIVTCTVNRFGRDLAERGYTLRKGTGGRREVRGLRLKPESLFAKTYKK
jgi:putative DNA primase/helicase